MKLLLSYNINELIRAIHNDKRRAVKERSGLCKAELIDGDYHVTDIFFPTQKNQTAHTEFTKEPLDELASYLIENDKLDDFGKYCIWLHSHQKMSAFWSGEDYQTRKGFKDRGSDGFISLVTSSTKGTHECMGVYYHATLDVFSPAEFELDLEVQLGLPYTKVEERQTERYSKYLEGLENLRKNAIQIQNRFGLTDEQISSLTMLDEKKYTGAKTQIFYTEPNEISFDMNAKKEELALVEEVLSYATKTYEHGHRDEEGIRRNYKKPKVQSSFFPEDEFEDDYDQKYKDLLS